MLLITARTTHAQGILNNTQNKKAEATQSLLALINVTIINSVEPSVQKH
jgi:hypothetical protein